MTTACRYLSDPLSSPLCVSLVSLGRDDSAQTLCILPAAGSAAACMECPALPLLAVSLLRLFPADRLGQNTIATPHALCETPCVRATGFGFCTHTGLALCSTHDLCGRLPASRHACCRVHALRTPAPCGACAFAPILSPLILSRVTSVVQQVHNMHAWLSDCCDSTVCRGWRQHPQDRGFCFGGTLLRRL